MPQVAAVRRCACCRRATGDQFPDERLSKPLVSIAEQFADGLAALDEAEKGPTTLTTMRNEAR